MSLIATILRVVGSLSVGFGLYALHADKPGIGCGLVVFGLQLLCISVEVPYA